MYIVRFYKDGVHNIAVSNAKALFALTYTFDKSKIQFKVYDGDMAVTPANMGWGNFEFWLNSDQSFSYN